MVELVVFMDLLFKGLESNKGTVSVAVVFVAVLSERQTVSEFFKDTLAA